MYTTDIGPRHAKWTARYPHGSRQQAAFWDPLLIWPGAVFSTDLELDVLHLIMTETGIWDPVSNEVGGRSILRSMRSILRSYLRSNED